MNLFEINEAIQKCVIIDDTVLDGETGEILDFDYLDSLAMARDEKIENIAKWIKNLDSDAKQLKEQKEEFEKRQKSAETKRDSLKSYLSAFLNGQKWDCAKDKSISISFRKSESVNILDEKKIPLYYLIPQKPNIDKTAIKANIKNGVSVEGAEIETKMNIQIK